MLPARVLVACWLVAWLIVSVARADDFRIETKVYSGKSKTPVSQNVTLFQAGYVYDYLSGPERVAVFDRPHGRFILLDPGRQLKSEIKTDDVMTFAKRIHELAAKNPSAVMKFAADPEFETNFSQDGSLSLASKYVTYRLQTEPAQSPEAAEQYREFSDWYARFNAILNPGSMPPFARLAVNEALADRGLVPTEVHLTISPQASLAGRGVSMRTEHHVSWRLLQKDMERIAETANQLATFKAAELSELTPKGTARR